MRFSRALTWPLAAASLFSASCGTKAQTATQPPVPSVVQQSPTLPAPPSTPSRPEEMRGIWVVRNSITTPAAIAKVVSTAKSHRFNTLFVQVRGRGDAFYLSSLEPRAEELSQQPSSFDPLADVIRQAHAAGLQVHAWMNTCYIWGAGRLPYAHSHIINQHPDWLARDEKGHYLLKSGPECEGAFITPANLAARQHIHDVFLDVARRYDIDGIHFDYIRYPNAHYDYSESALFRFKTELQTSLTPQQIAYFVAKGKKDRLIYPHAFPEQWRSFRQRQITDMVADISRDIKQTKPWVTVSAAVFADSKDALNARGQDWKTWLQQGYLDAVIPMAYGVSTALVAKQVADAVDCARSAHRFAYAGLGAWHIPTGSTVEKINVARSLGTQGEVLFSYGGVTHDGQSTAYLDKLTALCYPTMAAAPAMPWTAPRPASQSASVSILQEPHTP